MGEKRERLLRRVRTARATVIRLLTFTTLYPNAIHPRHGIFVETRLRQLIGSGCVDARVVAPVAWFPFTVRAFGRYAKLARVPAAVF